MIIDIIVAFNDVTITRNEASKLGMNCKTLNGRVISIVDQMVIMANTLKYNWKEITYRLYATHSRNISPTSKNKLESCGYKLVRMEDNLLPDRTSNRINAYKDFTDGDFSMVCDCDLLFIKPEKFNTKKMISAKLRNQPTNGIFKQYSDEVWKFLHKINNISEQVFDNYHNRSHFNNGCIFVDNNKKHILKTNIESCAKNVLLNIETLNKHTATKHFLEEIIVSLAIMKTQDYDYLPNKFNSIVSSSNGTEGYSMIHYASNNDVNKFRGYGLEKFL